MAKAKAKKREEVVAVGVDEEGKVVAEGSAKKIVVEEVAETGSEQPVTSEVTKVDDSSDEEVVGASVEAGATVPVETSSVPENSVETPTESDVSDEKEVESADGDDGEESIEEKKKDGYSVKVLFVMFMVGAICSGLILGGVLYFRSNTGSEPTPKPTLTPVMEDRDEATPVPSSESEELDLTGYKVQVQNGSGVAGIAGSTASILEDAGFEGVAAGNASTQDYEGVEISMKAAVEAEVYDVIADALSDYEATEGDGLDEDSSYDVVVIVGSN